MNYDRRSKEGVYSSCRHPVDGEITFDIAGTLDLELLNTCHAQLKCYVSKFVVRIIEGLRTKVESLVLS